MTFERFVPWATVVLGDFASVDHELGDVDMVFQNLADIQGIEDWSFGEDPWSEDQKAFERQWRKLPPVPSTSRSFARRWPGHTRAIDKAGG